MKNLIYMLLVYIALTSCQKEEFGQYQQTKENTYNSPDITTLYTYGGTLPNSGNATNTIVDTTCGLTKYVSAFAIESPNDTIQ